jgi:TP901 family phage tail tape measure protein
MAKSKKDLTLGVLFTGELSPELKKSVKNLEKLVTGLNKVLGKVGKAGGIKALAALAKQADKAAKAIQLSATSIDYFTKSSRTAWPAINKMNKAIDDNSMSWQEVSRQQAAWQKISQQSSKDLDKENKKLLAHGKASTSASNDLSAYSKAMVKADGNGKRFSATLSDLSKNQKNNSLQVKDNEKAMYQADKAIRQLTREVGTQSKTFATTSNAINTTTEKVGIAQQKWSAFKDATKLTTVAQGMLNGTIAKTKQGLADYVTQVTKGMVTFDKFTASKRKGWPIINKVNKAYDAGTKSLSSMVREQATYQSRLNGTLPSQLKAAAALKASKAEMDAFVEATKKAIPNTSKMNKEYDAGTRSLSSMVKEQATYRSAMNGTLPIQQQVVAKIEATRKAQIEATKAVTAATKKTTQFNAAKKALTTVYSGHTKKLNEFLPKLQAEKMSLGEVNKAMKAHVRRVDASTKANTAHIKKRDALLRQYPQLSSAIHKLDQQVKAGNATWASGSKHLQTMTENQKKTATGMKKAGAASKKLTGNISVLGKQIGSINGAYDRLMGAFKVTASYGIAATAIYSVINALKSGTQSIIDYDQGLKNLQAITGATDFEVEAMGETIKQVARDTKFSTTEAADGMTLLGQAGLNAGESMSAMRDTALLATGTLSDMKTSTDLVSTTIRAFGMSATESGRIVDVMANAVNKSKLTIDKLRTAFNYVAATASQAGLSIEQTAATMMTLANNGLRASTIGTGFRQVLSKMVKPSEKLAASLASVGLKLDDINPSMVGWQGTLKALATILWDADAKTVNMSKAFSLFGLRGAQAAAVVVKSFVSGDYQNALDKVYEIGTAEAMAAKQAEGLAVKLKNLIDRAGNVAVAFGEAGAANGIRVFLDATRETLAALENFLGSITGQVIFQLGVLAGSFKLTAMAARALFSSLAATNVIQAFTFSMKGLNASLAGKSGLVGALSMAGLYVKSFLTALGPLKIVIGLVAAAILTYRAAMAKTIKDAEKFAVKNLQIVDSLEAYRGALISTGEKALKMKGTTDLAKTANDAYIATLQRLIKAHPELTAELELSIDAYERNNEVVKEFTEAAHAEKMRALVDLYNEYGAAGERAMAWAGFWETVHAGFSAFVDAAAWGLDILTDGVQLYIDLWALVIGKLGEAAKHIPYFGDAASKMLLKTSKSLSGLKDNIITAYKEFGKGSEAAKEAAKKQKEMIETLADSYVGIGIKGKASFVEIQKALVKTGKLDAEGVRAVLRRIEEKRLAMTAYSHDIATQVKNATNKMTASWQEYYSKQDINGKVEVQQAWERLQTQFKDYVEVLQRMADANEITKEQMAATALLWWDKELADYKAKEAKQTESLNKALNKRQAAYLKDLKKRQAEYQKFADKIKSIEAKLEEDKKLLRQSEMTDTEKNKDNLIAARKALAEAVKATAEATTAKELEEAMKKVKIAETAYGDIVRAANTAAGLEVEAQKKSTETKKAIKTEELGWYTTNWELAAAREQIWNNAVIANLKAERDLYNKWYGKKAEERATADKTAADKMKAAATEAFGVVTKLLEDLQAKFMKKNKLEIDTGDVKEKTDAIEKNLRDIGTIATKEKTFKMDGKGAITETANIKTNVEDINTAVEKEKTLTVNVPEESKTDVAAMDTATTDIKANTETDKTLTIVVPEETKTDVGGINATLAEIVSKLEYIVSKTWESKHVITVIGLGALREAYSLHRRLDTMPTTRSKHIITTEREEAAKTGGPIGLDAGGKIQGYGGGDTVPAMLEKGEFVIRKEAVQKYGQGLFASLNSMVAGMKIGGMIPKVQMPKFSDGGSVSAASGFSLSNQLHTINLNVNNTPHKLYGDEQAVRGLVKTLRREQLVTA